MVSSAARWRALFLLLGLCVLVLGPFSAMGAAAATQGAVLSNGPTNGVQTNLPPNVQTNVPPDSPAGGQAPGDSPPTTPEASSSGLSLSSMLRAGGPVGYLIVLLSLVMVALIADHIMNIRRSILMPPGLAEEVHSCLAKRQVDDARKLCEQHPGYLGRLLHAGLQETSLGYASVEKAMEDTAVEQSARLFRRIEYLSVIGTIAPMLGLMGTVWGMIQAFLEFEQKANPQVSELAPGIYRALITTLLGLGVAVPSLSAFAIFRNRIDELSAESTLLAEHVFADFRRASQAKRRSRE